MFDKSGQWIHLETFDDFDNGLSELIDLCRGGTWSTARKPGMDRRECYDTSFRAKLGSVRTNDTAIY